MTKVDRVLIYGLLVLALFLGFRKPAPVVIQSSPPPVPVQKIEKLDEKKSDGLKRNQDGDIIEQLPISSLSAGRESRFWLEGVPLVVGCMTARGKVESVDSSGVVFRDYDGRKRFVVHCPAINQAVSKSPNGVGSSGGAASSKNGQSS